MIGRGTTPVIEYILENVDPQDIVASSFTIAQDDEIVIDRNEETMVRNESSVEWKLTQAETLLLNADINGICQLRVRTADGNAYDSPLAVIKILPVNKDGVI